MTHSHSGLALVVVTALALSASASSVLAQTAPANKAADTSKASKGGKKATKPAAAEFSVPAADAEQVTAAGKVYYGVYDCEFKDTVNIVASPKYPSYVDVKHDKSVYLMKPVLSSTGAIRLEDVHGEALMVQISSKSMLLNVKTGHRLVDDCVSPRQRELIEEMRIAKAAEAASAAAAGTTSAAK